MWSATARKANRIAISPLAMPNWTRVLGLVAYPKICPQELLEVTKCSIFILKKKRLIGINFWRMKKGSSKTSGNCTKVISVWLQPVLLKLKRTAARKGIFVQTSILRLKFFRDIFWSNDKNVTSVRNTLSIVENMLRTSAQCLNVYLNSCH